MYTIYNLQVTGREGANRGGINDVQSKNGPCIIDPKTVHGTVNTASETRKGEWDLIRKCSVSGGLTGWGHRGGHTGVSGCGGKGHGQNEGGDFGQHRPENGMG
jgi:hypothetical protein